VTLSSERAAEQIRQQHITALVATMRKQVSGCGCGYMYTWTCAWCVCDNVEA